MVKKGGEIPGEIPAEAEEVVTETRIVDGEPRTFRVRQLDTADRDVMARSMGRWVLPSPNTGRNINYLDPGIRGSERKRGQQLVGETRKQTDPTRST